MSAKLSKRVSWHLEAAGHTLIAALLRPLPAKTVFGFGRVVGGLLWPLMKKRRHFIMRNLRIALHPISIEEAAEKARESFIQTVANLVSSAISDKSRGGSFEKMLTVENPELLEEAAAAGRGVILLLAHMGNWELLTKLHGTFPKGIKSGAFYRPLNNPILNARVLKEREASGTYLFSKRDSLHKVGALLRENGVMGILADQRVGYQGEVVDFFGRLTRSSPLPSLLARRCKSEALSLSLRTVAPGKWVARYHRVEKPYHTANCAKALETAMKVSPVDVFWLQERWKIYLSGHQQIIHWLKKKDVRGQVPHRVLIWRNGGLKPIPKNYQHGDLEFEEVMGRPASELEAIDQSKELPVDFILAEQPDEELFRIAKKLCIPIAPVSGWEEVASAE